MYRAQGPSVSFMAELVRAADHLLKMAPQLDARLLVLQAGQVGGGVCTWVVWMCGVGWGGVGTLPHEAPNVEAMRLWRQCWWRQLGWALHS